jgi:putative ABC transport system permease protein
MIRFFSQLWRRLLYYKRRNEFDAGLEEEMRFHLRMRTEENIAAGMSAEEAGKAARRQFGNQTWLKEESREMWGFISIETLLQDLRFGLRLMLKKPLFTTVAILTLALGIGANTAIFSVVNAVLLRPLPYKHAERLVWIWGTNPQNDIEHEVASLPDYYDWKTQNQSFEEMGAYGSARVTLTSNGEPERFDAAYVTDGFFEVLGAQAETGRTFTPDEDKPGNENVVVISHALWQRRFGADPNIIGKALIINGEPCPLVGVMPADFNHPKPGASRSVEMWLPLGVDYVKAGRRGDYLNVIARLKPDVSVEQSSAELKMIAAQLEQQYPASNTGWSTLVIPLHERFVGDVRPVLIVLLGAVCFLLLIACVNMANLLLARAAARQKELTIRAALGARRWRIIRQLLTESVLLAVVGGALGLLLAVWGIQALVALGPSNIPRLSEVSLDGRVLASTFGVSLVTGVLFGLFPALQAANPNLNETLKEGGRGTTEGGRSGRARRVLVVAEVALALVPLVGAGLMVKSFMRLQDVNPGFNPERVMAVEVYLPGTTYKEGPQATAFYRELLTKVQNLPGVEAAGAIDALPLAGGGNLFAFYVEGQTLQPTDKTPDAEYRVVTPEYFQTMNIPLLRGRYLSEQDGPNTPNAFVINDTIARRYFAGEDPIGKRMNLGNADNPNWYTVVGIVQDTRQRSLGADPYPQMYAVNTQVSRRSMTLVVRTAGNPDAMIPTIRSTITAMDNALALNNARTMAQVMAQSIARPRFNMLLMSLFAVTALLLAAVGIYGVMAYSVTQRTHEIGVRMALGASSSDVLKMVVGQGMGLTLAGVCIGLVGAFVITRLVSSLLSGLLFQVGTNDPWTFAGIALLLALVALLACLIPARRATKVDPMAALRYE